MIRFLDDINNPTNYYTGISKKTGENHWEQDKFQRKMFEMIQDLDLSEKQLQNLSDCMVKYNQELDMVPSYNESKDIFDDFVKNKVQTHEKGKSLVQ